MAQIYRSRYFSKSDPLNAPLGSRPSYWRSIHEAQNMIRQGLRAIIGTGESINIWQHQWLGAKPAQAVYSTRNIPPELHQTVSRIRVVKDLIEDCGREWKQDLISIILPEEAARKILQLRQGGRLTRDRYAWDYSRSGHYSVKSGYWVLSEIINKRNECSSSRETVNHLLFKCTFSRLTWALSSFPVSPEGEWNSLLFQGKEFSALELTEKAKEDEDEWRLQKPPQQHTEAHQSTNSATTSWIPPPTDWIKCNSDGAWSENGTNTGLGWVVRNENGQVLWVEMRAMPRVNTVLESEIIALRNAVLMLSRFNYRKLIFESDSQQLVSIMNDGRDVPFLGPIIQDIRQAFQHFEEVKLHYTPRESNQVADKVARETISLENYVSRIFSLVPIWLKQLAEL
ncbi:PREDICTED: uncharacterized protein LOC104783743 [Camelina sativa]|uniref:Uncharacterized protein LOC104783743 n=1 Tax=Camelina sativa TaxID=90675 RepID=A0ABM0YX05_CAMSA|nr:PREDICTED: uncharacterized protein LOC104783743 [Camelina sativa]